MANVLITLNVDCVNFNQFAMNTCCTLAQFGGILITDPSRLANYISEVNAGDIITWNGVCNSSNIDYSTLDHVEVSINKIVMYSVFGDTTIPLVSLAPPDQPSTVQASVRGIEGDECAYSIYFSYVFFYKDGSRERYPKTEADSYHIDPKIRVHSTAH